MNATCLCPSQYPHWHEQDIDLSGSPTHSLSIPSFLYMPLSYDIYVRKQQDEIERLELEEKWPGFILSRSGLLRGKLIRILTTPTSPSRHFCNLAATFNVRGIMHDGGMDTLKVSTRKLQNNLFDLGRMPKELYLCHLTCPLCSEQKGGEKILLLRRWVKSQTLTNRIVVKKNP